MHHGEAASPSQLQAGHVVVLGATGLLGHVVFETMLANVREVTGVVRKGSEVSSWPVFARYGDRICRIDRTDLLASEPLIALLDDLAPSTIVNCVGLTPRRTDGADTIAAIRLNALLPHLLAQWARKSGCRLITISTDCVFDHEPGGFVESSPTSALDIYGRTKALGEVSDDLAVTLRTSFVGRELGTHTELLEWFLGHTGGEVSGYGNVWYSGVPVQTVAEVILKLATTHRDIVGIHHLAAHEPITKLDLLRVANDVFDAKVNIVPDPSVVSHRTLDGERFQNLLGLDPVDWRSSLDSLAGDDRYELSGMRG
jgi:dTDP-4-dehydrorhamnose reductase